MNPANAVHAVLPAGGLSSRMGGFKPLMDLGGMNVLARSVLAFRQAGVERVLVVTGHRAEDVAAEARRAGAVAVHNPNYEQGMFSSVLAGVRALEEGRDFFVHPADIPLVRSETVRLLLESHGLHRPLLTCPTFLGERGHPPLLDRSLRAMVLGYDGQGGLRGLLDSLPDLQDASARVREVACADAGILADLDRPEDHAAALDRLARAYPDERESLALWDICATPETVRAHCRAVARAAVLLAETINARGAAQLDVELARSAALVHDLLRAQKNHARAGAELLALHGFSDVVSIVANHPDLELSPNEPVTEREIVFLADKYVQGADRVDLETRYRAKIDKHGSVPGAREAIQGRLARAMVVRDRVEALTGRPLAEILGVGP